MEELSTVVNAKENVEATAKSAITSNNGKLRKGAIIGAAITGGGIALYYFGKKLVKKICGNKAEENTTKEENVETDDIKPDK